MFRCTSRTFAFVFVLIGAGLSLPGLAQLPERMYPAPGVASWVKVDDPATLGMDAQKLAEAQAYARTKFGAGIIARRGHKVAEWGNQEHRFPVMSVTKGIGALLLGLARERGLVTLEQPAAGFYPNVGIPPLENGQGTQGEWRTRLTIEQLATHSSGFDNTRRCDATGTLCVAEPRMRFEPGTAWLYSDGGANALADTLTFVFQRDLREVLHDEFLQHLGLSLRRQAGQPGDVEWRTRQLDPTLNGIDRREFNAGLSMKVDAMARFGLLIESGGMWDGHEILPAQYLQRMAASSPVIKDANLPILDSGGRDMSANFPGVTQHLGLFWFNNSDGTLENVPTDAFWTWGDGDHLIVVIPSLELVIARTSSVSDAVDDLSKRAAWQTCPLSGAWCTQYAALEPFLAPIAQAVIEEGEPPPPPPPGAPTVSLTSSATSVNAGGTVTLSWSSQNAESCTASNGWTGAKATSGSETVTVSQASTYVLACTGQGGTTEASVSISVNAANPPPPPPPSNGGGGGGGALQWWVLAGLLLAGGARRGLRVTRRRGTFAG